MALPLPGVQGLFMSVENEVVVMEPLTRQPTMRLA